jgi:hypothetical protein
MPFSVEVLAVSLCCDLCYMEMISLLVDDDCCRLDGSKSESRRGVEWGSREA